MNIFNSLGSNYNFDFVLNSLFVAGKKEDSEKLVAHLDEKYGGKTILLYKGREAIESALRLAKIEKGASVAVCGYTCYAVVKALENAGLIPVYVDIDDGLNFSSKALLRKLEERADIKAVIIQNTLGYPCDIFGIKKLADEKNLILIEDLAHSVGTVYGDGRSAGTVGDFTILSFSQDKMIDGISGGALVVRNKKYKYDLQLAQIAPRQESIDRFYPLLTFLIRKFYPLKLGKIFHFVLRKFGLLSQPMTYGDSGKLHALPSWYAAIVYREFEDIDKNVAHRAKIAKIYAENLNEKVMIREAAASIDDSTNLRFPILVKRRRELVTFLKKKGVYVSDIWYDAPVAPKKYMDKVKYKNDCKKSHEVAGMMLNLPTHKNVGEKDAEQIAELINLWLQK